MTDKSKNQSRKSKIEQTGGSNPDRAVLFTEDKKEQQSTENAAAFLNVLKESESLTPSENLTTSYEKPQLITQIKTNNTELSKNSQQQLKIPLQDKCSAQNAEFLNTDSYKKPAIDVTIPCTPEQIDLTHETSTIANSEAIELVKTHAIANPQATEIIAAVKQATGSMNLELKIYVLQYSLNEIQATINLLQTRSQTKQISNPSGWIVDCLRGRWWEKTNCFQNTIPAKVVSSSTPTNSSSTPTASSPTPTNSSPTETARITESYIDPQYMPLETHREFCKQFEILGKEAFEKLGVQQQIYSQWMHRFPQRLKSILVKLSKTT